MYWGHKHFLGIIDAINIKAVMWILINRMRIRIHKTWSMRFRIHKTWSMRIRIHDNKITNLISTQESQEKKYF